MTTAIFAPEWDHFTLTTINEGDGINVAPSFGIRSTITLAPNETDIMMSSEDRAALTSIYRDGASVAHTDITGGVRLPATSHTSIITLTRSGTPTFQVFVGQLPPGLTISSTGRLKGIVANIPSKQTTVYRFGLRATFAGKSADIVTQWSAIPADQTINWNYDTLPALTTDHDLATQPFYYMGEFKRGQTVDIVLDIINPDATPLAVLKRIPNTVLIGDDIFLNQFPMGLTTADNPFTISGFIPAEAVPGRYYVELYVDEPMPLQPIVLGFNLLGDSFDQFTAVNKLVWQTPAALGSFKEGQKSDITLVAEINTGEVSYALAPGSLSLPIGMVLAENGELQGKFPHADATFEFTVKATSGRFIAIKTFRFSVTSIFLTAKSLTASLLISGDEKSYWTTAASALTDHYRPDDPHFTPRSSITVIRGLKNAPLSDLPYGKPIELLLGPYKVAQMVRNGVAVYDVVYRDVIDPMARAGGFVANTQSIIPEIVTYPQNPEIKITDASIHNFRCDLVQHLELNSAIQKLEIGELLDEWATSYKPITVIAYLKPGTAAAQIGSLSYGSKPIGSVVRFDRLLLDDGTTSYFYFLGYDHNDPTAIVAGVPLTPSNFQIDGLTDSQATGVFPQPTLTWTARESEVEYRLDIYNIDVLLRSETLEGTSYRYSSTLQSVDDQPGYVRFVLVAKRGDLVSPLVTATALLHAGWGYAWGLRYGGLV